MRGREMWALLFTCVVGVAKRVSIADATQSTPATTATPIHRQSLCGNSAGHLRSGRNPRMDITAHLCCDEASVCRCAVLPREAQAVLKADMLLREGA